jgi:arylsulfatase A-like enzyme
MYRRSVLLLAAWCFVTRALGEQGVAVEAKKNLLMIISDQHRWDCLSEAGNPIIHTPNLDQLAKEGAHFTRAYTICPVCCPSRTSMLAGQTPEQTKVRGNADMSTGPRMMTFDRILLSGGWSGEYHGKYHSP